MLRQTFLLLVSVLLAPPRSMTERSHIVFSAHPATAPTDVETRRLARP